MGPADKRRDFANRLTWLFENVIKEGSKRYTSAEVAAAVGVSPAHLRKLKVGVSANPTKELIEKLAEFFGVKPAFFLDPQPDDLASLYFINQVNRLDPQPDPLELLEQVALRAAASAEGMSKQTLTEMLATISKLRRTPSS